MPVIPSKNLNGHTIVAPKLTNRGGAGLLSKLTTEQRRVLGETTPTPAPSLEEIPEARYRITPALAGLAVPISSLVFDPENARDHPDRNMDAIRASLKSYGQVKPVVVRKSTRVVVAGNGTLQAAKDLGWTEIAATFVDMNEIEAAGFGLADNRTAELAKWNFEVVNRLDRLLQTHNHVNVGWSVEELQVLRTDWTSLEQHLADQTELEEHTEPIEEVEEGENDAELLMKLQVTLAEPESKVQYGEVYRLGIHTLVVADVSLDVKLWRQYLTDDMIFAAYPGPLILHTEKALTESILLVQPHFFIASYILDQYKRVFGQQADLVQPSIGE